MRIFGKLLELVVFDVDGVLLDLHLVLQKNLEDTARALGLDAQPIDNFMQQMATGKDPGKQGFLSGLARILNLSNDDKIQFAATFARVEHANPIPAFSFTDTTLSWLRTHGILLALCTNNSQEGLSWKLTTANIPADYFISSATSSLGFHKPDPKMLEHVIGESRVSKERTVFVGDWHADILAAKAADVEFIGTLSGSLRKNVFLDHGIPEDHIIDSINDLPCIIEA